MKIKKGDKIQVISGKYRGKTGIVEKVSPKKNKVLIPGINIVKKHHRAKSASEPGGIIEKPAPIDVSAVMLVCPKCGMRTRVRYKVTGKEKMRVCKKCGAEI